MKPNPQPHHRRSIRLPDYDYSQPGFYFITIVTHGRENLFGEIKDGEMQLNDCGRIVWEVWNALPARYPSVTTGAAMVMPNHFHGIVCLVGAVRVGVIHELPLQNPQSALPENELPLHKLPQQQRRRMTLPLVVGYFKMNTAKQINKILDSEAVPVWQRNYYEHIIRNEEEYNRIHLYIEANVTNWALDEENPFRSQE